MAFGTIAQMIDVLIRHNEGISERKLVEISNCDPSGIRKDCEWLVKEGYIELIGGEGPDRQYKKSRERNSRSARRSMSTAIHGQGALPGWQ